MKVPLDNAAALAAAIGQRVRALRESLGLTQEKLAYESGLRSKGTLSKIEAGHQLPSVAVLDLLARRLGVELLDLFVRPDADHPRHTLIDATRELATPTLRAMLDALSRPAREPTSLPFVEVSQPRDPDAAGVVPLVGLDVAAGGFDSARTDRGTRWVKPLTSRRLPRGCFVVRVVGRSMEPTLFDGAWAIFSRHVSTSPEGQVVIAQYGGLVDADTAASYTVKRFRGIPAPDGAEAPWREVHLEPDNRAFDPIVVNGERLQDLSIVAELVEVLDAAPGRNAR